MVFKQSDSEDNSVMPAIAAARAPTTSGHFLCGVAYSDSEFPDESIQRALGCLYSDTIITT
jgi:hypothetical protein